MTDFLQSVVLALVSELKQRYPDYEIDATPCFTYDLTSGGSNPCVEVLKSRTPTNYQMTAIRGGIDCRSEALFSLTVSVELITITIHSDRPIPSNTFQTYEGLPGVEIGTIMSDECNVKRFVLAESGCIEEILAMLEQAYPQEQRNGNAQLDRIL